MDQQASEAWHGGAGRGLVGRVVSMRGASWKGKELQISVVWRGAACPGAHVRVRRGRDYRLPGLDETRFGKPARGVAGPCLARQDRELQLPGLGPVWHGQEWRCSAGFGWAGIRRFAWRGQVRRCYVWRVAVGRGSAGTYRLPGSGAEGHGGARHCVVRRGRDKPASKAWNGKARQCLASWARAGQGSNRFPRRGLVWRCELPPGYAWRGLARRG